MYSSFSSSSSSSPGAYSNNYNHHKEEKSAKRTPTIHSKLRSLHKSKNTMKKPIAPWPRTPPKVYKVAPVDFRDFVQKLTGAPQFQPTRLHEAAAREWFPLPHEHVMGYAPPFAEEEPRRVVETISFGELMMSPRALSASPPSLCMDFMYSLRP